MNSVKESILPNNPYMPVDSLSISGLGAYPNLGFYEMLATFDYTLSNTGVMSVDPKTGFNYGDLTYYSVFVSDGTQEVGASLDLQTLSQFDVPTSTLNANTPWKVRFAGNRGADESDAGYSLEYEFFINSPSSLIASGAINTTTPPPSVWSNIELTLFLRATTDANFTLFPENGVVVKRGDDLDLNKYSTTQQLTNGASYIFQVKVKRKKGLDAGLNTEVVSGDFTVSTTGFPFAIGTLPKELYSDLTLDTSNNGSRTGSLGYQVTNGGVLTSTIFKLSFTVA
jgi:hypothetical protein